jgi:chromosomal replication initiation ATPase DnaA
MFFYGSGNEKLTQICEAIAVRTGIPVKDIRGRSKERAKVQARHLAWWLMRKLTGASLPAIGRLSGKRHHTSILHGVREIERLRHAYPGWWQVMIDSLLAELQEDQEKSRESK